MIMHLRAFNARVVVWAAAWEEGGLMVAEMV